TVRAEKTKVRTVIRILTFFSVRVIVLNLPLLWGTIISEKYFLAINFSLNYHEKKF
ncbi:unnamed protein product, partial [marine sediment metagenome]